MSRDLNDFQFSGNGKIITFTKVHTTQVNSESGENDNLCVESPYVLAIIELEEGPRLTSQIADSDSPAIGDKVELVFRKLSQKGDQGVIRYGYKFKTT